MRLTIFNGSPKPGPNNTEILINNFINGFRETDGNEAEVFRMNNEKAYREAAIVFEKAEAVMIAFPLYVYAMPAGVKTFIEELEPLLGKCGGKKICFLVQYGFREGIHARPLEKYLERLSNELGCDYQGTIIKGGCDGLVKHQGANKKILQGIYEIGKRYGEQNKLDKEQLDSYSAPNVEKKQNIFLMKIVLKLINMLYWEAAFKKNGVTYEDSFAKPYGD